MTPRCNLHTHTTFCDGKNTAEEMVLGAIDAGCETLGFSGHSPIPFDNWWCMTEEGMGDYIREISRLREKYRGRIEILLGLEYDLFSDCDTSPFDYIIGSSHYVDFKGNKISIDDEASILEAGVNEFYGGDFYALARDYYDNMYYIPEHTKCDIIGHFDLVTKFNEGGRYFDETDERYRSRAYAALGFLLEKELVLEINTGAVSRGYRKNPYPADFILKYIAEKRGRVMLNSDSHLIETLFFGFADAVEYAKACGIRKLTVMKNGKFDEIKI